MQRTSKQHSSQGSNLFYEEQRFRQPWLWGLLGIGALLMMGLFGYGLYQQLYLDKPWGDKPMSDMALVIVALFVCILEGGILWLFYAMTLKVRLDSVNLYIHFTPFTKRTIPLSDIRHCEARTYSPILEYGGWGIRHSWRKGMAYNVMGNRGVLMELKDGKKLLIGSQRAEALAATIQRAKSHR